MHDMDEAEVEAEVQVEEAENHTQPQNIPNSETKNVAQHHWKIKKISLLTRTLKNPKTGSNKYQT